MCGIIVSEMKIGKEVLEKQAVTLEKRGPDQRQIKTINDHAFVFTRLSIMGLSETGMQPFELNGKMLVANGEIYNFRSIKQELQKKYEFKSESDCEVLLPLFEEYHTDMFSLLDAEFALVLSDPKYGLIAARDPLGIRPLFYGTVKYTNKLIFASEVKAIMELSDQVKAFPPGHFYINGQFVKYTTITDVKKYHNADLEEITENIRVKLTTGIIKRLDSDAPIGFLLSGGLDSSIVCAVSQKYLNQPIKTFAIGMDTDPIDLKYAKEVADYIGADHTEVRMTKEEVISSIREIIYALETYDITTIRASIGMYLISKYIHQNTSIKVLMTGEVSDELFGYKYTDFAPSPTAFQEECKKRIDEIFMYDVLRADRCLAGNSLEARVPFGDIDFASYVMRINPLVKMNSYRIGKYLLRKAFETDYLPRHIVYREKAAFSDAVGHSMVDYVKEYAESLYTDKEFIFKKEQYNTVKPFTKEALLYREIFNEYYPKHDHLIPGYWMPNKSWKGCNVDDPSARVLKNYGKSGE